MKKRLKSIPKKRPNQYANSAFRVFGKNLTILLIELMFIFSLFLMSIADSNIRQIGGFKPNNTRNSINIAGFETGITTPQVNTLFEYLKSVLDFWGISK